MTLLQLCTQQVNLCSFLSFFMVVLWLTRSNRSPSLFSQGAQNVMRYPGGVSCHDCSSLEAHRAISALSGSKQVCSQGDKAIIIGWLMWPSEGRWDGQEFRGKNGCLWEVLHGTQQAALWQLAEHRSELLPQIPLKQPGGGGGGGGGWFLPIV